MMLYDLKDYIISQLSNIPSCIYWSLILVLIISLILLTVRKETFPFHTILRLLLVEYIVMTFMLTIVFRDVRESFEYNYMPLWSYGRSYLLKQIIMNVISFIPIGFLLKGSLPKWSTLKIIGAGVFVSSIIEITQFLLRRGFSELDDIIHNTLGVFIGCILYNTIIKSCRSFSN